MLGSIWFFMIFIGILYGAFTRDLEGLNSIILKETQEGVTFVISLIGIMSFWLGIMNVAEKSGLVQKISNCFRPVVRLLFSGIPRGHAAERWIIMNYIANMFGISGAATVFGLKAMKELDRLNTNKRVATNSMAMFLIINMSSLQLIPLTVIKIRYDYGSHNPTGIVGVALMATLSSTILSIIIGKIFEGGK